MVIRVILATSVLLMLPLLGVFLAGYPPGRYLEFPPESRYIQHAAFSWAAFAAYAAAILAAAAPLTIRALRSAGSARKEAARPRPFPWWGWPGLSTGLLFWVLAWNRFPWFRPLQGHTFVPLWLSFILVVNALTVRRKGSSLLTRQRYFLLLLFPASAVFWWIFEYLNRFVQNWHYVGVHYTAGKYLLHATLSFSTVLPAVLSVREWLLTFPWLQGAFADYVAVGWLASRRILCGILLTAAAALTATGVWPDYLFSLLWTGPLLIIVTLQALWGESLVLQGLRRGDWRPFVASALAALICGWFWEMWNFCSLAKWEYSVPFVDRFRIFEMPLLGYAGYLPFGLECAAVAELVAAMQSGFSKAGRLPFDLPSDRRRYRPGD